MIGNFAYRHGCARRNLLALTAAAVLSCLPTRAVQAVDTKVSIDNFTFTPSVLTVEAGDTVVFENNDDTPHLIVDADGKFRSKALDTDDKFSVTIAKPGEITYFCGLHPRMHGKIIATP
jgi:plastocyanin